ncbi:MAG: hypothetical protein COA79_01340 [Planctomycetota bacterium]|nr:MAG: hypothetical protein COA79_01340 [Planctomycetota bacterium]
MKKSFLSVLILFIVLSFLFNEIEGHSSNKNYLGDFDIESFIEKGYYFKVGDRLFGIASPLNENECFILFGADKVRSNLIFFVPLKMNTVIFGIIFISATLVFLVVVLQSKRSKVESKAEE